ncbi:MAG: HD domain-containing protein [Bacteroidota bacterium]
MDIDLRPAEAAIIHKISAAANKLNMPCWLIGGFVRDKILGRQTKDLDVVCIGDGIALAQEVANLFSPKPNVSFFKNFGTAQIKIFSAPATTINEQDEKVTGEAFEIEFVGARKESYRTDSRKPEVVPGTLKDDQERRDFTINALAIDLAKDAFGKLVDPFGGMAHLEQKLIKTPLDPVLTFSDDPLRMMRAVRFAAQLNFSIDDTTFKAIETDKDRIRIVSRERIADELNKIVLSPKPSIGFIHLYKSGLLELIFPQMVALAGAQNIDGHGHKDNFFHTLQVLDNISEHTDNLWLRWAAILHDIGKPATKRFEEGTGWTFHGHEVVGGRMVPKIFTQLKLPMNEKMRYVRKLVELHLRPISLTKENITDSAIRRLLFDAGDDFEDLMTLCNADITSKNKIKVRRYMANFEIVKQRCAEVEDKDRVRNWQPPIDGQVIMETFNLAPGREVGIIKNALKEAMLEGIVDNSYEAAYQFMLTEAAKLNLQPASIKPNQQ